MILTLSVASICYITYRHISMVHKIYPSREMQEILQKKKIRSDKRKVQLKEISGENFMIKNF